MPSPRYSLSRSALRSANGRTATDAIFVSFLSNAALAATASASRRLDAERKRFGKLPRAPKPLLGPSGKTPPQVFPHHGIRDFPRPVRGNRLPEVLDQQLVQHHAHRVDVGLHGGRPAHQNLGREVGVRPRRGRSRVPGGGEARGTDAGERLGRQQPADSEVGQLDGRLAAVARPGPPGTAGRTGDQDVPGLDVPVNDPGVVRRRQALGRLRHQLQPQIDRHPRSAALRRAPTLQVAAGDVLLFQVERRPVQADIQQLHQARVVAHTRPPHPEERHLPLEGPHPVFPQAELEDAQLLQAGVPRQPDLAEAAGAELLLEDPRRARHLGVNGRTPSSPHARARLAGRRQLVRQRPDEAVAVLGKSLDEPGTLGGVAERLAQPADRGVEVVVEIDEDLARPETVLQLAAGDDTAGMLEERGQDLEGLVAQPDTDAPLAEESALQVDFEVAEAKDGGPCRFRFRHASASRLPGDYAEPPGRVNHAARGGRSRNTVPSTR